MCINGNSIGTAIAWLPHERNVGSAECHHAISHMIQILGFVSLISHTFLLLELNIPIRGNNHISECNILQFGRNIDVKYLGQFPRKLPHGQNVIKMHRV